MKTACLVALSLLGLWMGGCTNSTEDESDANAGAITGAPSEHVGPDAEKRGRLADIVAQYRAAHVSNIREFAGEELERNQFVRQHITDLQKSDYHWRVRPFTVTGTGMYVLEATAPSQGTWLVFLGFELGSPRMEYGTCKLAKGGPNMEDCSTKMEIGSSR